MKKGGRDWDYHVSSRALLGPIVDWDETTSQSFLLLLLLDEERKNYIQMRFAFWSDLN